AMTIEDKKYSYKDFANFLQPIAAMLPDWEDEKTLSSIYENFEDISLKDYYKNHLAEANPEYARVIKEYKEGILLFALMEEKIWNKAKDDTTGLKTFFIQNQSHYVKPKRYDVLLATASDEKNAEKAQEMVRNNKSPREIKEDLNIDGKVNVFFTQKITTLDDKFFPENYKPKKGVSKIYKGKDYVVVDLKNILPEENESLDEVKGRVINDYQQYLEKNWLKKLETEYSVVVNEKVFEKIKKELSR
ncbi:MAG: peptidylprolyl isomerase, partial [Leeuwenhoekiella sp.]